MPKIVVLPHEDLCPEGAVLEAQTGESVLDVALKMALALSMLAKNHVHVPLAIL